ncbi:HEPN domain-containing protein [Aquimarina sp. AU474]|uniref:HEPN domain-containing protein n=1 Tax=Aquimarina sp. AU474 TaxID=2108529 RepID=UPI000D69FCBB|nr:HEPN domain-containing protein [Aquimarina sp. AU474]
MYKNIAILRNSTPSLELLNPYLKNEGYEFKSYNPEEFENMFRVLIGGFSIDTPRTMGIKYTTGAFSHEFFNVLENLGFREELDRNKGVFTVCQSIDTFNKNKLIEKIRELAYEIVNPLISKLHLFKPGGLSPFKFCSINEQNELAGITLLGPLHRGLHNDFRIDETETKDLVKFLKRVNLDNNLCKIALENLELTYLTDSFETTFTCLMTALESLLNFDRYQISHTVSRHLALIISKNEDEFQVNYAKIKKIYNTRSYIVHGNRDKISKNSNVQLTELNSFVRKAIIYVLESGITDKKELFKKLNAMGYR